MWLSVLRTRAAGAQVGLVMRELPALWGEAGTGNVDHLKPLRFQDTLLKLRSVNVHPFITPPPRIIMLLKLFLHFSAVWHPHFLVPDVA